MGNPALKGRQHRWWSQATRSRRPQTSTRRPPSDTKRNIATPLPNTSRAFANGNTIAAGETQAQAGPSVARQRIKHWNHLRVSIKHARGNIKASETKARPPRVLRGREGVTLGILRPLRSGYYTSSKGGSVRRREGNGGRICWLAASHKGVLNTSQQLALIWSMWRAQPPKLRQCPEAGLLPG